MNTDRVKPDLAEWWSQVGAVALVGTVRRQPPDPPDGLPHRPDAGPEAHTLDAAALGGAIVRAGAHTRPAPPEPEPAEPDRLPEAPAPAAQLLQLALHQSPAGPLLRRHLVAVWLRAAAATGHRVPHHLLPDLFTLAATAPELRDLTLRTADARGRWLARANPAWQWRTTTEPSADAHTISADDWAHSTTEERLAVVARLRTSDPARARELVESTWSRDTVGDRLALLQSLRTGLRPDDEPLLERALDDRSRQVRDAAQDLLDGLPGSARAARMAERLKPLVTVTGQRHKEIEVRLPADPDPAAVRDGLGRPPRGTSRRGYWLTRLAAGAPIALWTELTGADPVKTWTMITNDDVRVGIVRAALAQRDPRWSRTLVLAGETLDLLGALSRDEVEQVAASVLARTTAADHLPRLITDIPPPWTLEFSRALLTQLARTPLPRSRLTGLVGALAAGLHPDALPELRRLAGHASPSDPLGQLVQYLSFIPAITEAFR